MDDAGNLVRGATFFVGILLWLTYLLTKKLRIRIMAKSKDGIEVGEFEGPEKDAVASESKQRGGEGSAKSNLYAHPATEFAHKQPCCK